MKKAFQLLLVTLFIATLTSCSSDNNDIVREKLLKSIVEVNTDGTSSTYNFTYNGNKIVSIDSETFSKTFSYTDNLITKIVELNNETHKQTTFDYLYSDNKLIKIICSDNYNLNYVYNQDGTVSYEKTTTDTNNNIVLLFHGVISFKNGNVYEDKKIDDNTDVNILQKEEVSFVYDTKRNPLNNIVGYDKLLDHFNAISSNNTTLCVKNNSISYLGTDQIISSATQHSRVFKYDNEGYPTEILSEKPVFENQNTNHQKSLYFYK